MVFLIRSQIASTAFLPVQTDDDENHRDRGQHTGNQREQNDISNGVDFIIEDQLRMINVKCGRIEASGIIHRGKVIGNQIEMGGDEHENQIDSFGNESMTNTG